MLVFEKVPAHKRYNIIEDVFDNEDSKRAERRREVVCIRWKKRRGLNEVWATNREQTLSLPWG